MSAYITGDSVNSYQDLVKPPLSPPAIVFPIVWTILYALMGIASYIIYQSDSPLKRSALLVYGISLVVNLLWSPIFFNYELYLISFIWLLLLWVLIIITIALFSRINKTAAKLMIPYLLWVTFAGYLNLSIYLLNR